MLFHEIYSAYYNAVAAILSKAVSGVLTERDIKQICDEKAFSESFLTICPALVSSEWQLLHENMTTPLEQEPSQPLSLLQKRWLKAVSLDPRMKLFGLDWGFLDEVQPLYEPEDIVVFDKYTDGDPFEDEHYIEVFRTLLQAVKSERTVEIAYNSTKGSFRRFRCIPVKLEYSEKDDKFRLRAKGCRNIEFINLAGIESVAFTDGHLYLGNDTNSDTVRCFEAELTDERNALERAMLHFAHFERETTRIADGRYRLKVTYHAGDETELIIRVLSFGPMMKVISPDSFVEGIRQRLKLQHDRGIR